MPLKTQAVVDSEIAFQLFNNLSVHHESLLKYEKDKMSRQANDINIKLDRLLSDALVDIQSYWDTENISQSMSTPQSLYADEMPATMLDCEQRLNELTESYIEQVDNVGAHLIKKRQIQLNKNDVNHSNLIQELNMDPLILEENVTKLIQEFMIECSLLVRKFDAYLAQHISDVRGDSYNLE